MEGEKPYLDTAVYHRQQAAEKALKALLTYRCSIRENA
jgi:HEPN domain-containing protein